MQKKQALLPLLLLSIFFVQAQRPNGPSHAVLLRGAYLQPATPTSIVVRWRTDVLTRGVVGYSKSLNGPCKSTTDSVLVTEHKILLKGLEPATKNYYSIGAYRDY